MSGRYGPGTWNYSPFARAMHWLMAALVIFQIAAGLIMTADVPESSVLGRISAALSLYDLHKLLGMLLLLLIFVRIGYRVIAGAPDDEPTLEPWQKEASHFTHAWIYLLLIVLPLVGWIGISLYPAVVALGIKIPAILPPDRKASVIAFAIHTYAAFVLIALIAMHVGAALYHHVIRKDGVLVRMLPGLRRLDDR
ncbi:MAG: cytochrome b [Hyphomicrobiaceae bacterium]|nr:cytochrome b [Hyphomicrobiaceae bacterium]